MFGADLRNRLSPLSLSSIPHHLLTDQLAHGRGLRFGHLEQQLVVDLEDEPGAAPLLSRAAVDSDHRAALVMAAFDPCMTKLTASRSVWKTRSSCGPSSPTSVERASQRRHR
jgi:hypothetical protein